MRRNSPNDLHAGIYRRHGEIGKLWVWLRKLEPISEQEVCSRLNEAGIKRPQERLDWIARDGRNPQKAGQTHQWTLRREGGLVWMEDVRER